jgi:hypothetical protein
MNNTIDLDDLAVNLVGDGKEPNLYFVSVLNGEGSVIAILTDQNAAMTTALSLGEDYPVLVEDRLNGEIWGNRCYERLQEQDE